MGQKSGKVLQTRRQGCTLSEEVRPGRPCALCGDCKCNSQEESQSLESRKESDTGGKRPVPPTRGLTFSMTINVFYDEPIIYLHITVPFMNFG